MIEILGLSTLSLLLIKYFSPIQPLREALVGYIIKVMIKRNWWWLEYPAKVLSCPFCFSFWLTVGLTLNISTASSVAILTMIVMLIIDSLNKYLYGDE